MGISVVRASRSMRTPRLPIYMTGYWRAMFIERWSRDAWGMVARTAAWALAISKVTAASLALYS